MTLISGSLLFFVIWWIVIFTVLPLGIQTDENPQTGFATGTPKNPNLKKKFLITTLLTSIIWGIIQIIMVNQWVTFT